VEGHVEHQKAEPDRLNRNTVRALVQILGPFLFVLSGVVLHGYIAIVTRGWLAPWSQVPDHLRPAVGTWQRTVNDFFAESPGAALPAWLVLVISVTLFVRRLLRSQERRLLLLEFATLNTLFVLVDLALVVPAHLLADLLLEQPLPEGDVGYHHTWLAIVVTVGLLVMLFRAQAAGSLPKHKPMSDTAQALFVGGFLLLLFLMRL